MPAPTYPVQAPVAIPSLNCARVVAMPGGFCITFPGGASMCFQVGMRTGDLVAFTEAMFSMINSSLLPLVPLFNILDVLIALFNCITTIPEAIVNPKALVDCIEKLGQAIAKVVGMLPQLSIPRLIKGILLALGLALSGFAQELEALIAQEVRLAQAATKAAEPGNIHLQTIVDCATGNFDLQLQNLNAAMAPMNRLIGLMNILLQLTPGAPQIPTIDNLPPDATEALDVIVQAGAIMVQIANAIPVPA